MDIITRLRTLYFNFRYLPFRVALVRPVLVERNFSFRDTRLRRGQLQFDSPYRYQAVLGGGKSPGIQAVTSCIVMEDKSRIVFHGHARFSEGFCLRCEHDASIEVGHNFYCNANCYIRSASKITLGSETSLAWGVEVNTNDGHLIWHDGKQSVVEAPIVIGNHVWVTPHCSVQKGAVVPDDCVVAQRSVVTKAFTETHCLIGGAPAKVIRQGIEWHI